MPLFHRIRNPDGTHSMKEVDVLEPKPDAPLIAPSATAAPVVGMKRYHCTLCDDKDFATAGVASMHFAKVHKDLKSGKDSWRSFIKEFGHIGGTSAANPS